jgi:hypothetical protein
VKWLVNGESYDADLGSLTLGEWRVIHHYSGAGMKEADLNNPDVLAGMAAVLIKRKYPAMPESEVEKRVNSIDLQTLIEADDSPLAEATTNESGDSSSSSGENALALTQAQ